MRGCKQELDGRQGIGLPDFMYAATTQDPPWPHPQSFSFGCRTAESLSSQETLAAADAEVARHLQLVLGGDALPFQLVFSHVEGVYMLRSFSTSLSIFTISCGMQRYGCISCGAETV